MARDDTDDLDTPTPPLSPKKIIGEPAKPISLSGPLVGKPIGEKPLSAIGDMRQKRNLGRPLQLRGGRR